MGDDAKRRMEKHKDVMQYTKSSVTRAFGQAMAENNMKGMLKIILKAKLMKYVFEISFLTHSCLEI